MSGTSRIPSDSTSRASNLGTHLAFGNGPHFCVGAALARAEMTSAFRALLTRLDEIRLAAEVPHPPHHPNLYQLIFKELRIEFRRADGSPSGFGQGQSVQ